MKYYIGNNCLDIDKEELESSFLGEGLEGSCYLIGNDVLKIYRDIPCKTVISEKECRKLTEIETSRFILPNDLIYDEDGKYIGYTSDFKETEYIKGNNLKAKDVLNEFRLLEKDVEVLSNNDVDIYDLNLGNTIISNGIYLFDVGSYRIMNNPRFLRSFNKEVINLYELEEFIFNIIDLTRQEKRMLKNKLLSDGDYLTNVIDLFCLDEEENIRKFFKSMAR